MNGVRLSELADRLGARLVGDPERVVTGVRSLDDAGPDDLAVLHNPRYARRAGESRAGAILVREPAGLETRNLLLHEDPYLALARALEILYPPDEAAPGVHPSAVVADDVELGDGVSIGPCAVLERGALIGDRTVIGPGCVIGRDAVVGSECRLHARVVVASECRVGDRCVLQPGVVIGGDGFGFATSNGEHHKVPHVGRAIIEDDVEIGANSTVDRGSLGDTVVGRGSKIDNLVMLAHNVCIGAGSLLAAQVGIAGSTEVGKFAVMGGQSGVSGHLVLADGVQIGGKSAVFRHLHEGGLYSGIPARPHREWMRTQAAAARVDRLRDRIGELERRLAELEKSAGRG